MYQVAKPKDLPDIGQDELAEAVLLGVQLYRFAAITEWVGRWVTTPFGMTNSEAGNVYGVHLTPRQALDAYIAAHSRAAGGSHA